MLVLERRCAAVEHDLALRDASRELAESEGEPGRKRALTQRDELGRRMNEVADRTSDDAARAHAEQALRGGIQVGDQQRVVEHDERGRESLKYVARIGRAFRAARRACAARNRSLVADLRLRLTGGCGFASGAFGF